MARSKKVLTQEEKEKHIIKVIDDARNVMRLYDWKFNINFAQLHKDTVAYVEPSPLYYRAKITVNLKWLDVLMNDPTQLSSTIWHELEHVIDSPMKHLLTENIRVLQEANRALAMAWYKAEDERITTQRTTLHDKVTSE